MHRTARNCWNDSKSPQGFSGVANQMEGGGRRETGAHGLGGGGGGAPARSTIEDALGAGKDDETGTVWLRSATAVPTALARYTIRRSLFVRGKVDLLQSLSGGGGYARPDAPGRVAEQCRATWRTPVTSSAGGGASIPPHKRVMARAENRWRCRRRRCRGYSESETAVELEAKDCLFICFRLGATHFRRISRSQRHHQRMRWRTGRRERNTAVWQHVEMAMDRAGGFAVKGTMTSVELGP